jgi:hypothetical protein
MELDDFVDNVKNGIVPEHSPIQGMDLDMYAWKARKECTDRGMWAIVDKTWTRGLARWIGNRKCLEVMAGAGWLANALNYHGVDIIATDNFSWNEKAHKKMKLVYSVEELGGIESVQKYSDRDILIISWPPYESNEIISICDEWGYEKPIVHIGEGMCGCNAPDAFWNRFNANDWSTEIPQWDGIHDYLCVGKWSKIKVNLGRELEEIE